MKFEFVSSLKMLKIYGLLLILERFRWKALCDVFIYFSLYLKMKLYQLQVFFIENCKKLFHHQFRIN